MAFLLTGLEPCTSTKLSTYVIIFVHQWVQLLAFFAYPLLLYRNRDFTIWYDIMVFCFFGYILLQNNTKLVNNAKKPQSCVVSQYTNASCGRHSQDFMRDPMYYSGLKSNAKRYSYYYNIYVSFIFTLCAIHLFTKLNIATFLCT